MSQPTYSSRDFTISWAGYVFEGLAPDNFAVLARNGDIATFEVGGDGQVAKSFNPDQSGNVQVSLQQNSRSNQVMSAVMNAQDLKRTVISASMVISDRAGSVVARAVAASIMTPPEMSFGSSSEGSVFTYTFFCEQLQWLAVPAGLDQVSTQVLAGVDTIVKSVATL